MASNLQNLDSLGGFSRKNNTEIVSETFDVKNVNTFEIKKFFYDDSTTSHYILRGLNTTFSKQIMLVLRLSCHQIQSILLNQQS